MLRSVVLLLSLAVIASAGPFSKNLKKFVSTLESNNGRFEQKINEVVNDYDNNPNGNKLVKKLEKIASTNVNLNIYTMLNAIESQIPLVSDPEVVQSLQTVYNFVEGIYNRNALVQSVATQLSTDINDLSLGLNPSQDIATNFGLLRNADRFSFYQISVIVAGLTL